MGKISPEYVTPIRETLDVEKQAIDKIIKKTEEANKVENILKNEQANKKQRQLRNLNKIQIK